MIQEGETTSRAAPVLEVIVVSVADAIEAQRGGAGRLEIVRDFQSGGLTPSFELVQAILDAVTLPVRVMLRENDSYEVEGEAEIETMVEAASRLCGLNVDGVVLGFLRGGEINAQLTERVLSHVPNLHATFHHAFEECENQLQAIKVLKEIKQIDRILTKGGSGNWAEKITRLARYQKAAAPEIEILAGGGIDEESMQMTCQATTIREFHVGRAARVQASTLEVVQADRVKALVEILHQSFEP